MFFAVKSQEVSDSIKIKNIEKELQSYGKQNLITDKVTLLQFGVVIVGTLIGIPALPLLIVTTALNLINVIINWKADKKLSEFNKNNKSYG